MKRSIELIVAKRYFQSFGHLSMALVVRCLGFGITNPIIGDPTDTPSIDGTWAKATDGSERIASNEFLRGLIAGYLNRPELNRHIRSGKRRRLAVLPT